MPLFRGRDEDGALVDRLKYIVFFDPTVLISDEKSHALEEIVNH